jgi:hypothetical protein
LVSFLLKFVRWWGNQLRRPSFYQTSIAYFEIVPLIFHDPPAGRPTIRPSDHSPFFLPVLFFFLF